MERDKSSTEILAERLINSTNIETFLDTQTVKIEAVRFHDFLYKLVDSKGLKISECLKKSAINESYGYQLFNGTRQPSRSKVLQIALGINLTMEETNRLLKLAEKSELYVKDQRDAVIMFALNKNWSLYDTEALIIERGLESLMKT